MTKNFLWVSTTRYPLLNLLLSHQTPTGLAVSIDSEVRDEKLWGHYTKNGVSLSGFDTSDLGASVIDMELTLVQPTSKYAAVSTVLNEFGKSGHWLAVDKIEAPSYELSGADQTDQVASKHFAYIKWAVDSVLNAMDAEHLKFNGQRIAGLILSQPLKSDLASVALRSSMLLANGVPQPAWLTTAQAQNDFNAKVAMAVGCAVIITEFNNEH